MINRDSDAFVKTEDEFIPLPGTYDAIAELCRSGLLVAVCTNQSGVGRGLLSEQTLQKIHAKLTSGVARAGGKISSIRYCPHLPDDGCDCRKPKPGMIHSLIAELDGEATATTLIGDSLRDIQAGLAAGCRVVLVRTGNGADSEAAVRALGCEEVFDDLASFARAEVARIQAATEAQQ